MMKKTLWVLLLTALLLLAGCGTDEKQEPTERPLVEVQIPYETVERELKYQGTALTLQSMWQREDPQTRILLEAAKLFEKQTGAVVTILWSGEHAATPEKPEKTDIFQLSASDFAALPKEHTLDLTQMASAAQYDAKSHAALRQQIMEQCGYLGAVAQVPYLGGIYYNTEIFQQCDIQMTPETWEQFLAVCRMLKAFGWDPLTLDSSDAVTAMELHLRRTIGDEEMVRLMGKKAYWHYDQAVIAAMEQVANFVRDGNLAGNAPADDPAGQNRMALSSSAMMVGTNADCTDVEEATFTDLNWGVFPYPGNVSSGTWMTADVLMIHRDCPNGQAAFDFLMLLATGEFDQLRADISGGIPADPANESSITGAMDAIKESQPVALGVFGSRQLNAAVRLWSAWYQKAQSYASALERSK